MMDLAGGGLKHILTKEISSSGGYRHKTAANPTRQLTAFNRAVQPFGEATASLLNSSFAGGEAPMGVTVMHSALSCPRIELQSELIHN